ncbi:thioredoxin family protein [Pedobacter gandavensis]|uniref:thioredoxin family protein n=1 Tax=Pedobacter TaxID=84567 RepID=UPI000706A68C|nr:MULTISPECIES: thioredoxin family protein [Pedobacter]ALL08864.1 glutaredoxin [Pedobacter sp. PACM 27299]MBC8984182.1 thioredoxin family protein [Pedobacter sp. N36a]WGQ09597.1 thioredoxin family protein [Pedobacter gandavensis]
MSTKRIIKFEKEDCSPCNMVSEYLDRKGVVYETINPFNQPELAMQFRVRSVPTVILMEAEQEMARVIGYKPEELAALAV